MMRGLITETDFAECDRAFPGIVHYYWQLHEKPRTFLELVWRYTQGRSDSALPPSASGCEPPHGLGRGGPSSTAASASQL
jgi:hypothetical protein